MRRAVLLAAVLAGSLAHADPRTSDAVPTTADGILDPFSRSGFDRGGSSAIFDWRPDRTGGAWAGAPSASWDCIGDSFDGETWPCGATTFYGGVTSTVGTPFYPSGFGAAGARAVPFDGTGGFDAGNQSAPAGSFTVCGAFRNTASGAQAITAKWSVAGQGWVLFTNTATMNLEIDALGAGANISGAGLSANAWSVGCASYLFVTSGTSVLRLNVNGQATAPVTNAIGPAGASAQPLRIGNDGSNEHFNGAIQRVTFWDGWAASDAQLDAMVRGYWGMTPAKGGPVTVSRAAPQNTVINGTMYAVPANVVPLNEKGAQIYGAGSNAIPNALSIAACWNSTCTPNTADTPAPDGSATAIKVCDNATSNYHLLYPNYAPLATALCSAYVKAGTKTWANLTCWDGPNTATTFNLSTCTPGTDNINGGGEKLGNGWCRLWMRYAYVGGNLEVGPANGDQMYTYAGDGTGCVYVWGMQAETSAAAPSYPSPYQPTAGTPVSWPDTASSAPLVGLPITTSFSVVIDVTGLGNTWSRDPGGLWLLGSAYPSANMYDLEVSGGSLLPVIFDASVGQWYGVFPHSFAEGSRHVVSMAAAGKSQRLFYDGVEVSASGSGGAGTGVWSTPPTTAHFGWVNAARTMSGYVSRFTVCSSSNPSRCK
jgi:hypothetical protein